MCEEHLKENGHLAQACQRHELENFLIGFMAEFSYFVPLQFLFCKEKKKDLGDFLVAPEGLWNQE